jgi:predicted ATPase
MLIDDGLLRRDDGHWVARGDLGAIAVPPSIHALLSARLDRLDREERAVIERASVVGRVFYRRAVSDLSPEPLRSNVPARLRMLVRRELIRPHAAEFEDETYRFRHILIRDAAYEAMPKEVRADLHERFAAWLEQATGERIREYEEIVGYHLEQAYAFRAELGPVDARARDVAHRAGRYLGRAGRRASARGDVSGSVNLITRAIELLARDDRDRIRLLPILAENLQERTELARSGELIEEALALARESHDPVALAHASVVQCLQRISTDPTYKFAEGLQVLRPAVENADAIDDHEVRRLAEEMLAAFLFWAGRSQEAVEELDRSLERSRRRGESEAEALRISRALAGPLVWGAVPVEEGIRRASQALEHTSGGFQAHLRWALAGLLAMRGDFERADEEMGTALAQMEEFGMHLTLAAGQVPAMIDLLKGDAEAAEARLRPGIERLREAGETGFMSTSAAELAEALCVQGRFEEAEEWTRVSEEASALDDPASQLKWRASRAKVEVARGRFDEAERLAREAVEQGLRTDHLTLHGEAWFVLAGVRRARGDTDGARDAATKAIDAWERKGITVQVERAKAWLGNLP